MKPTTQCHQAKLPKIGKMFFVCNTSGMPVDFSVAGMMEFLPPKLTELLYHLCQEALTNALHHGKAKQAFINLCFHDQSIKLNISDDGQGCQTINKGMGLTNMEQRVKELNGTIEYGSSGESGFSLTWRYQVNSS
jgi:signal transduction histidine kinase